MIVIKLQTAKFISRYDEIIYKKKEKVKLIHIMADVSFPKIFNFHKTLEK